MYIVHHVKWLQFMVNGLIPFRLNSYAHQKNVKRATLNTEILRGYVRIQRGEWRRRCG